MSDKIFALYLEQIAQRLSDDIAELKEHLPSEPGEVILGQHMVRWPVLENLQTTQNFVQCAATDLMRGDNGKRG